MEDRVNSPQHDEVTLKDLLLKVADFVRFILTKWYIVAVFGLVGGLIGFFYADSKDRTYTATTTFVLESSEKSGLSQYAGVAAAVGIDLGGNAGGIFQGDNILELYKSRSMIERALLSKTFEEGDELLIERFMSLGNNSETDSDKLIKLPDFDFRRNSEGSSAEENRFKDSLITNFTKTINTSFLKVDKADKKSSLIQVDVTSTDEIFSKSFNESLVAHVNKFYINTKTGKSLKYIQALEKKIDSVSTVMSGAIYSSAEIMDRTPNLNPIRQVQRMAPSQKAQFSAETNKAILSQLIQNLEISKMSLVQEQPLIQIVDYPIFPLEVKSYSKTKFTVIGMFVLISMSIIGIFIYRFLKDVLRSH